MPKINLGGLLIYGIAAFIVWYLLTWAFPAFAGMNILFAVMLAVGATGILALVIPQIGAVAPVKLTALWSVALIVIALFGAGMFSLSTFGIGGTIVGLPSAAISADNIAIDVSSLSECQKSAVRIGDSATGIVNGYNVIATTPNTAVDLGQIDYYNVLDLSEANRANLRTTAGDTTAASITGFSSGDVITVVPQNNATYYVEPVGSKCVASKDWGMTIKGYALVTEPEMNITVYDRTGTALTASTTGDAVSCYDYNLPMIASDNVDIQIEVSANGANNAFYLGGIAVATFNDVNKVEPTGNSADLFEKVATPLWGNNKPVAINQTGSGYSNMTVSYTFWKLKNPILLKATQGPKWVTYDFRATASSTDPATDATCGATSTSFDGFAAIAYDLAWARDASTGKPTLNFHDMSTDEANVGISESVNSPRGRATGVLVQAT